MNKNTLMTALCASLLGFAPLDRLSAQTMVSFDSGSSGADGELIIGTDPDGDGLYTCATPGDTTVVDVGASGIRQYTRLIVGADCTLKFTPTGNSSNHASKPVRLLISGDARIDGSIDLDGQPGNAGSGTLIALGGVGGPGGYDGGASGMHGIAAQPGYGPGGGSGVALDANLDCPAISGTDGNTLPFENDPHLQPLTGGSGGGGGCGSSNYAGNGGGGAMLLAVSGRLSIDGQISALGAKGFGGNGAHGILSLMATTLAGNGSIYAKRTLAEASDHQETFSTITGEYYPMYLQRLTLDLNQTPTLSISSIGGIAITGGGVTSLGAAGSTTVVLSASGLAEGTEVTVAVSGGASSDISDVVSASGVLDANGMASITVAIPSGVSLITAYVSKPLLVTAAIPDYQQEKILVARLEARPGRPSILRFYTESGKPVPDDHVRQPWRYVSGFQG